MILFPNCKINIGLDIVNRRPDGYHDIETIMVPVPWTDILEIVPASDSELSLEVTGNAMDCPMEKNLVVKAFRAVEAVYGIPPVHIFLHKIIPDGAGLGGGSADAAFTIMALNKMFGLGMDNETMARIAATIGADCPFFIYNKPQLATGIGTDFSPISLSLKKLWMVIVKPQVSVPTKEAYANVTPCRPSKPLSEIIAETDISGWQGKVKNDFEPGIFKNHPQLALIKQSMLNNGAVYSSMTGSGSAIYAIFTDEDSARLTRDEFRHLKNVMFKLDI